MSQLGPWYRRKHKGWREARLLDHATVANGYPFGSERFSTEEGFPLVRIRDISEVDTEVRYNGPWVDAAEIETGDVLVGMDGDFNVARWQGGKALLNQRVCCVRVGETLDAAFVSYILPLPLQLINELTYATTVKHLSSFDVLKVRFLLPELEVQRAISRSLDRETTRIGTLINEKERMLALLEEKRAAEVTRAVTRGLNPRVAPKPSGLPWLGEIPKHWDLKRSKRLLTERDERSESGEEEMLTVSHLTGVTPRSEKDVNMFEAESNEGYKLVSPNQLVINTLWAWMGAMGVAQHEGIVSPAYHVYRIGPELLPAYVDLLVRTEAFKAEVIRFSKGVWSSRLRLYPEGLYEVWLPVPPLEEQDKIVSYLAADRQRTAELEAALKESIRLLQERRRALITAAVTGEIEV